jgi:FG-GAP repeat
VIVNVTATSRGTKVNTTSNVTSDQGTGAPATASLMVGSFTQYGSKLVGTGYTGSTVGQGTSVALSGDGETLIVGAPGDNSSLGAAWVFTHVGNSWVQQGPKLIGGNNVGAASEGSSVGLSADGNTAIVGGPGDNGNTGAAWIFTRSRGTWSQQAKVVANNAIGAAQQGSAVALSGDGNTALVGGPLDNSTAGAVWVFALSNGAWVQQAKLIGTGAVGAPLAGCQSACQGLAVALSADGNTAIVGGPWDAPCCGGDRRGAAWIFTRSGGVWTQQGAKLLGSTNVNQGAFQGASVALSADGGTALIGGPSDQSGTGAAWVFINSGGTWTQQGDKLVAANESGSQA